MTLAKIQASSQPSTSFCSLNFRLQNALFLPKDHLGEQAGEAGSAGDRKEKARECHGYIKRAEKLQEHGALSCLAPVVPVAGQKGNRVNFNQ